MTATVTREIKQLFPDLASIEDADLRDRGVADHRRLAGRRRAAGADHGLLAGLADHRPGDAGDHKQHAGPGLRRRQDGGGGGHRLAGRICDRGARQIT